MITVSLSPTPPRFYQIHTHSCSLSLENKRASKAKTKQNKKQLDKTKASKPESVKTNRKGAKETAQETHGDASTYTLHTQKSHKDTVRKYEKCPDKAL